MSVKLAFFILLMISTVSFAEESPNLPPRIEEPQPKIEESQINKERTQEEHPTVGVVEVKPPINETTTKQQRNEQNADTRKPIDYQWWFNFFLVVLTAGLVIVGRLQVRVYREQARYMRDGLEVTRQSVKAAQDSADAARKSIEVATTAFHLTQRPRIRIRGYIANPSSVDFAIILDIVNYGGTNAIIRGCQMRIFLYPTKADIDLIFSAALHTKYLPDLITPGVILKAGESHRLLPPLYNIHVTSDTDFMRGQLTLYVQCYVSYQGEKEDIGGHYSTQCLRRLKSHDALMLVKTHDPNYEYED